jgi:TonB family protein
LLALVSVSMAGAQAGEGPVPDRVISQHAGCTVETTPARPPDDYYPPGSIRRSESGEVIIEFTVGNGTTSVSDVVLVKGSGLEALDHAALRLARSLRVATSCSEQRVRRSIVFDHWRDPREKVERRGCLIYDPAVLAVSIFPIDED